MLPSPPLPPRRRPQVQLHDGTSCYDSSHTPDVGILLEDAALRTCSPAHCTSDDGEGGEDCHAGQRYEGCTCSPGYSAKVIASIGYGSDGLEYYEYECCNDGTGTDGEYRSTTTTTRRRR